MASINIVCRNCGEHLMTYTLGNEKKRYESPIKKCRNCGSLYRDVRCCEIAIEGITDESSGVAAGVVEIVLGALIAWRGKYLFGMHQLNTIEQLQWVLPSVFLLLGIVLFIAGIYEVITNNKSTKQRKYKKLMKESEERLSDSNYVELLKNMGYKIPEKYDKESMNYGKYEG